VVLQTDITTVEQLDAILDDETDHRLVVVKFYASWYVHWFKHRALLESPLSPLSSWSLFGYQFRCKTCAVVGLKMDKLASEHADWVSRSNIDSSSPPNDATIGARRGAVRFVNVEYGAARDVCRQLKIERLPTIFMYMPKASCDSSDTSSSRTMQKVHGFSCSSKDFHLVQDLLTGYVQQQQRQMETTSQESFESTLDAGRDLIQATLEAETNQVYGELLSDPTLLPAADAAAATSTTNASLWRRLRQRF
jgi:hypothetical protein